MILWIGSKTLFDEDNIGRVLSEDRDYGLTEEDVKVVKIGMSLCMYLSYLLPNFYLFRFVVLKDETILKM